VSDLIQTARASIDRVLHGDATAEDVLATIDVIDALKALTRNLADRSEAAIIAWIEQHGQIERGEVRYYTGPNKTVRCRNHEATVEAVLSASHGDLAAVARCLSSSAWKAGAVRELLPPDEMDGLFEVLVSRDLKSGRPIKRLQKADGRFNAKRIERRPGDGTGATDVSAAD